MSEAKNLRCSILAIGDFPEGGAVSQRLYLLTRLLQQGLGDAELWILHPTSKTDMPENSRVEGTWNGVRFQYLNGSPIRPSGAKGALLDTLKGIYRCLKLLNERNPDVLVVYTPAFFKFIVPILAAKVLRIPVIVESCEIPSTQLDRLQLDPIRRMANSGETLMERLIPKLSVGLLPISRRIQDYYLHRGLTIDAAYLLPVLIDFDYYRTAGQMPFEALRGQRYLLNSGTFTEKDGLSYLVAAASQVRNSHPDIKLVFTGAPSPTIRQKILQMGGGGAEKWIMFTGFLSRDQLVWCYKHALGLLSCRSNSSYANYGFPTKLAEYLAAGTPVIATRVGDIEEYLVDSENAFLAKPENVASIADAILRLLTNSERAALVGNSGREVARQYFDYNNHIQGVADFIRRRTPSLSQKK